MIKKYKPLISNTIEHSDGLEIILNNDYGKHQKEFYSLFLEAERFGGDWQGTIKHSFSIPSTRLVNSTVKKPESPQINSKKEANGSSEDKILKLRKYFASKLSAVEIAESITFLLKEGFTRNQIAESVGCGSSTIYKYSIVKKKAPPVRKELQIGPNKEENN